jgi:hemoglobin
MMDPDKSLYLRLGGYDAIAAFADDLLRRLRSDPQLGVYWKGKSVEGMKRHRQLLVDFLSQVAGGPVQYTGMDMKTSHEGMGITEDEWNVFVRITIATLDDLGVPEQEKTDFLACAGGLKGDIVEVGQQAAARA